MDEHHVGPGEWLRSYWPVLVAVVVIVIVVLVIILATNSATMRTP